MYVPDACTQIKMHRFPIYRLWKGAHAETVIIL